MEELNDLRKRVRRQAIGYYIIGGLSMILAVFAIFVNPVIALVFVSYTVILYVLGCKGYKLAYTEQSGGEKSFFVLAVLVASFNFLISGLLLIPLGMSRNAGLLLPVIMFAAVGLFAVYSALTAKKLKKVNESITAVEPFVVGRGQPVMGYLLAEEEV